VRPEEIAQPDKGPDCLDIGGWFSVLDSLELVFSGFDTFQCKRESKVGNFLVSKYAFLQVDL
jgi:hypothetical protein